MVLGVLVTISSVGAGALGVTALILLYPELPVVKIAAPTSPMPCRSPWWRAWAIWPAGGSMSPCWNPCWWARLPGIVIASLFAPRLPDLALRLVLAATLTVSGLRLLA